MKTTEQQSEQDQEANYFAMCLLLPENLVRKAVRELPARDVASSIRTLAKMFQVEDHVMTARLVELGYDIGLSA